MRAPRRTAPRVYEDQRYVANRERLQKIDDVCHWCGRAIDMQLRYPHPASWSCDHIIPKVHLQPDDPRNWHISNLCAAHLRCNQARGDKPMSQAPAQRGRRVAPLAW